MPGFIGGLPAQGSPLSSADVRNNFLALNARTGKLTPRATVPASTSIKIDAGKIYFADKIEIDFPGQLLDLGDDVTGVSSFAPDNIGFFKDIIIVVRVSFNTESSRHEATAVFIEGPEKSSSTADPTLVQMRATDIPVAAFTVRHNGLINSFKGQIEPINQSQILDLRNYIDAGGITYYSATVGDRQVLEDGYGTVLADGYGVPLIQGETVGMFTGLVFEDGYGFIHPIQQAIDSVSAAGGGTVFLRRGTYTPNASITVPDNIQLLGEGASTIIQREDTFAEPMIVVTGNNVKISNLCIKGPPTHFNATDALVEFRTASYCTIKDCLIDANGVLAISYKSSSTRNICANNYILNANTGVRVDDSTKILVLGNQFENCSPDTDPSDLSLADSLGESNILS